MGTAGTVDMHIQHVDGVHSRHRQRRLAAMAITVALLAAACSTDSGRSDRPSVSDTRPPTAAAVTTTGTIADDIEWQTLAASLTDDAGGQIDATVAPVELDGLPASFTAAGPAVEIEVRDGVVMEPVVLSLPGARPPDGAIPVLLHLVASGTWEMDSATYSDGFYRAEVTSFSPRIPGWWNDTAFDSVGDWVTGRTDPPADCDPDPYGWVAAGNAPADGSFHACVRRNALPDGTERVEVVIKSNRSMAQWVTIPDFPYDYLWVEGFGDWQQMAALLTELDQAFGPTRVLLAPGRTMTLGYRRPVGSGPRLEFSSYQNNTTQIASLAYKYLGDAGFIGLAATAVLCLDTAFDNGKGDVRFSELDAAETADCFIHLIREVAIDETFGGLARALRGRFDGMVREGRWRLSTGATDGIEQLLRRASTAKYVALAAARLLTAVKVLADATSMAQDTALAFTPGLNTYTVFLVGSASPTTTQAPTTTVAPSGFAPLPPVVSCDAVNAFPIWGVDGWNQQNYTTFHLRAYGVDAASRSIDLELVDDDYRVMLIYTIRDNTVVDIQEFDLWEGEVSSPLDVRYAGVVGQQQVVRFESAWTSQSSEEWLYFGCSVGVLEAPEPG